MWETWHGCTWQVGHTYSLGKFGPNMYRTIIFCIIISICDSDRPAKFVHHLAIVSLKTSFVKSKYRLCRTISGSDRHYILVTVIVLDRFSPNSPKKVTVPNLPSANSHVCLSREDNLWYDSVEDNSCINQFTFCYSLSDNRL